MSIKTWRLAASENLSIAMPASAPHYQKHVGLRCGRACNRGSSMDLHTFHILPTNSILLPQDTVLL